MDIETLITIIFTVLFLIIGATRKKKEAPVVLDSANNADVELHFGSNVQAKESKINTGKYGKNIAKEQISNPKQQMKSPKRESIFKPTAEWKEDTVKQDQKSPVDFDLKKAVIFSEILKPKYF